VKISEMLNKWDVKSDQLHYVVTDNAANMKKAMSDAGYRGNLDGTGG